MIQHIHVKIRSKSPLLMHRYIGEQPTMKKPRVKTQEWIDQIHKKDWMNSAYFSPDLGFYITGDMIDGMLCQGARQKRQGMVFKAFVICEQLEIPIRVYKSAEDNEGKYLTGRLEDYFRPEYIDLRGVVIKDIRIDRCRPIFRFWGLEFPLQYDNEELELSDIQTALRYASLADFRPRFGRFQVTQIEELGGDEELAA